MAENSPPLPPPAAPPPPPPPPAVSNNPDPIQYWCYQCDKRVPVETVPDNPDVICFECKNGFVESISVSSHARQVSNEETPAFGNEFIQVLRMIAQAAREDDEPPPPPPSDHPAGDNDYLRIELDGWNNGDDVVIDEEDQEYRDQVRARWYYDEEDEEDEEEEEEDDDNEPEEEIDNRIDEQIDNRIDEQIENRNEEQIENRIEEDDEIVRRERRDVLRLRLRQVASRAASRAASRHNRILDWAEMLMGLEDQSIEFRLQLTGDNDNDDEDAYVGNPGDYVDAAGYEALLETLAESDIGGRRGPPAAAKSAVENLHTVEVNSVISSCIEICAVCKDEVWNNEGKIVKQLECGHMYHGECIIPWLGWRNTCPVCRYELPTDDAEYEEDRKRRLMIMAEAADAAAAAADDDGGAGGGCSSSSGAVE